MVFPYIESVALVQIYRKSMHIIRTANCERLFGLSPWQSCNYLSWNIDEASVCILQSGWSVLRTIHPKNFQYHEVLIHVSQPSEVGRELAWGEGWGVYWFPFVCSSVRPCVRPSVLRWCDLRGIITVCFVITTSNFISASLMPLSGSQIVFMDKCQTLWGFIFVLPSHGSLATNAACLQL